VIPVAAPAAQHGPDVPVDRLDGAEGDFLVAVVQDPVPMPRQQAAELLEGQQPLPPQGAEPGGQEASGPALIGVGPQLGELVSEEVGLGQPPVEGKELAERLAVLPVQVRLQDRPNPWSGTKNVLGLSGRYAAWRVRTPGGSRFGAPNSPLGGVGSNGAGAPQRGAGAPHRDAATNPGLVGDKGDVRIEVESELPRVATADVEVVEVRQHAERRDRALETPGPPLIPDPLPGSVAELFLVGLPLTEGVVRQLEMGRQTPVPVERRAETRPQRDYELNATPLHDGQSLKVGVVGDPRRLAETAPQRSREVEAGPGSVAKIGRREHLPVADDAGEADGDPVVVRK
jgi:hypothetical protein